MRISMSVLLLAAVFSPLCVLAEEVSDKEPQLTAADCRVIFMDFVDPYTMKALMDELELRTACPSVLLIIDTPGGDVAAANFFLPDLEAMRLHTHIRGEAASMGVPLFLTGDERTMDAGADLFLHQIFTTMPADTDMNVDDLGKMSESLQKLQNRYVDYVATRTGQSAGEVLGMMQKETTVEPAEAVKMGFATGIKFY